MLKRGYHGTYHKMSPKHLQRYVNEFSGRHNIRCKDTIDRCGRLCGASKGAGLARPISWELSSERQAEVPAH